MDCSIELKIATHVLNQLDIGFKSLTAKRFQSGWKNTILNLG
jgi:hypothetical protein